MSRTPGLGVLPDRLIYFWSGDGAGSGTHVKKIDDFFTDAAAGKLPQVAFVDPDIGHEGPAQDDEHPPAVMQVGQKLLAQVTDALGRSPQWPSSALFITYDEHGGLYDHVPPPPACKPDDYAPELDPGDVQAGFDQLGVRVPLIVVSPFAKQHFVGHRVYDHTSILRFIEARFVLPALTIRDAYAEAPWELFDVSGVPHRAPPAVPIPDVDSASISRCVALFGSPQ
jgi:phospholipase C